VLADEINRTPPKNAIGAAGSQQELSCTVRGNQYKLPFAFFVARHAEPHRTGGTYALPEAQLDRFLFNTVLDYLSAADEIKVVDLTTARASRRLRPYLGGRDSGFPTARAHGSDWRISCRIRCQSGSRHAPQSGSAPDFVKKYVNYGGSVRAAQFIVSGVQSARPHASPLPRDV